MKHLFNLFVLFAVVSFCAPDLYAFRLQKTPEDDEAFRAEEAERLSKFLNPPDDDEAFRAEEVERQFKNILTDSGPFLTDIPAGDAENLRRYFDSAAWKKMLRSLSEKEREKVERDIADYFLLYENIRTLETWETEGKQVKSADIQAMEWPGNADSYLMFYEAFRKADAKMRNLLLTHIISRRTNDSDFRGENFTEDCILLLLKDLPAPESFAEKKDIVGFHGRLEHVFEFLQRHSYVLMSLSNAELEKMAAAFEALEKELPIPNIFYYEIYIRFIRAKKESPEAEAAYFEKTVRQCLEDYNSTEGLIDLEHSRGFGKDAVVYDYLLRHPDRRAKYMDMFTDKYLFEFVSGLFELTWRLPYTIPDEE